MNRKYLPSILMLAAGTVTCIINLIRRYPLLNQLMILLIVLIVFYLMGCILKWTLDSFDRQNEKGTPEEGEVIEKEAEQGGQEKREEQS